MGDLNTDLLSHCSIRCAKLRHVIESASLQVLPLQATHHNANGEDSWLDLILVSDPSLVSSHGQHPAPGFSHHDLIFLSYILKPPKPKPKVLYRRCFGRMNAKKLKDDALNINWEPLMTATSVDEKVNIFNEAISNLYNIHAPVKKVKLKRPPAPWMTDDIRKAMACRDKAYRAFRRNKCDENRTSFKLARNRCNQMIRNAKRRHILDNISSSSSSNVWKFLGSLGIGKPRSEEFPKTINVNDINRHFVSNGSLDESTKIQTIDYIAGLSNPNITSFQLSPVSSGEIKKIILSIKSKAVGCDDVSRVMIVSAIDQLLPAISHILNFSLTSSQFPHLWRIAYVRPLPKIPNASLPSHFRPISILPFLSKVLEACVHRQLSGFVNRNNILSPLQSGFRPGHSTVSALLKVTGDVRAGVEDTKITVLVLVDFSNAFNTVSHDILLSILSHLKISPEALEWFASYLRGRQQSVHIDGTSSDLCNLSSGVPQGGILSPLLFSMFINLITAHLQSAYHLYADDLQLYTQAKIDDVSTAIGKVNNDLNAIRDWSARFGLMVNPLKCQAILIGSPYMVARLDKANLQPIMFDGSIIPLSTSVKDLGIYIDEKLDWQTQVANISRRVTGALRSLYRLKNFLPSGTKAMLVQTLIFPVIDYGDVCYFDLNADLLNKLDRLLNNCIRFVFNLRKYDHISEYRSQLKWLPIRQRRNMRALTMLYSLLNSPQAPTYLTPYFKYLYCNHNRDLRSSNNLLLLCPSHTSSLVHSSFYIQAILLWNALPLEIRMSTNRESFKARVRQHLYDRLPESS